MSLGQNEFYSKYEEKPIVSNWFFYWKTSSSLWREKLEFQCDSEILFIPINWSFHFDEDKYDFGGIRPETDLELLSSTLDSIGQIYTYILPLSPFPYIQNGGVPSKFARYVSKSSNGIYKVVRRPNGEMTKIYSYFDPNIYKNFRKFVWELGKYIECLSFSVPILGVDFGHNENGQFQSYFKDNSPVYFAGKRKYEVLEDKSNLSFYDTIKNLYIQTAKEALKDNWHGKIKIGLLGGSLSDLISFSIDDEYCLEGLTNDVDQLVVSDIIPSDILLDEDFRSESLYQVIKETNSQIYLNEKIRNNFFENENVLQFVPYRPFKISIGSDKDKSHWSEIGLTSFLRHRYPGLFVFERNFSNEDPYEEFNDNTFIYGLTTNINDEFDLIIKKFLGGNSIIIDTKFFDEDLNKKLKCFVLENSLKVYEFSHLVKISIASFYENKIIFFNSNLLLDTPFLKRIAFWEKIEELMSFRILTIRSEDKVFTSWQRRCPTLLERDLSEVRRLNVFNLSSYKKKITISMLPSYNFYREVEKKYAEVNIGSINLEIVLWPKGKASIEFGVNL